MNIGPDYSPQDGTGIDIDAIEFTESLAASRAFENYLFANMAQRRATHTMHENSSPITLSRENIQAVIPEEMRDIFGSGDHRIEGLSIFQEESHDLSYFFMRFLIDGETHSLTTQSDQAYSVYTKPNSYGDSVSYTLSNSVPVGFLASLTYIREYDAIHALTQQATKLPHLPNEEAPEGNEEDMFSLEESAIEAPRLAHSDMLERLIMTLGQFDGMSHIETSGLIPVGNQILFATLKHTDSPQLTHASNELDLSVFDGTIGTSRFDRLSIIQQLADIKAFQGEDFNDQLGETSEQGAITRVDPDKNPTAWNSLCHELAKTMKTELESFLYLDETA